MENDDKKVVAVKSFNSVMEAQLYKALLESAGVPARMQNDIVAQVMPVYGAYMDVRLLVAEEDEKRALQILDAKFDIDEFERETHSKPEKKQAGEKPAAKKAHAAKETAAKKRSAGVKTTLTKKTGGKTVVKKTATTKKSPVKKK